MDLSLDTDLGKLNIRVAAWIESQNSLLVSKYSGGIISLPGGRVKFSETTLEAVKREILEETEEEFYDVELFSVIENFFLEKQTKRDFHEFLFVYKGKIREKKEYHGVDKDNQNITWGSLKGINELKPSVFSELVGFKNINNITHLVNID
ncbi:MAG: NUDIX domain-containing protein [Carnobacterium sp.]|uniref:NUDIX domain-containing protein n=1 Tax=Carnobacterium sp. TaxID=48221 RepID=UPI0033148525